MAKTIKTIVGVAVLLTAFSAFATPVAAAPSPDLLVTAVPNPPDSRAQGDFFKPKDTTKNRGKAPARSSDTRYRLSTNRTKSKGDLKLRPPRDIPRLDPGEKDSGGQRLRVPNDTPLGDYYVIACADTFGKVTEKREGNNCSASSTLMEVTDGVAPQPPEITETNPTSHSSDETPRVLGTAEVGAIVDIFFGNSCAGEPEATGVASDGTFDLEVTVPSNSSTSLRATATDGAGNRSDCSDPFEYVHDQSVPASPTIGGFDPASPSNVNDPKIFGTAEPNSTVLIYSSSANCTAGTNLRTQGTASDFASPGVAVGPVPENAQTTFFVKVQDLANNLSGCAQATYTEDSTPPGPASISGTNPNGVTSDNEPEVFGSAPAGTTVRLFKNEDCFGAPAATGTPAQFASPGLTVHVVDNTATPITAAAVDAAGNQSTCSSQVTYLHDSPALESEANNTPGTANAYTRVVSGSLQPAQESDYFSVVVPPGGRIEAETFRPDRSDCTAEMDTILWLYGTDGTTRLAADGEDGAGRCSLIDGGGLDPAARDLDPGTYYVRLWALDQVLDYRLRIDAGSTPGESEPNDAFGTATPMKGRWAGGDIDPGGDFDFFSFHVPDDGTIAAETFDSSGTGCSGFDSALTVFAPNGTTVVGADDDHSGTTCSKVTHNSGLAEGTYFARVRSSGAAQPFDNYSMKVTTGRTTPPSEVESNDSTADAEARAPGVLIDGSERYTGAISSVGDVDFYKVSRAASTVMRFETFEPGGIDCTDATRTTIRLYDSSGVQTKMDAGSGIGRCGAVVAEVPAGTSYVSVERTGNSATLAEYVLEAKVLSPAGSEVEPNETAGAATTLAGTNIVGSGSHPTGTDSDFYKVTVPPGGKAMRAEVIEGGAESCEGGGIDSRLTLYDSAGKELADDDDSGRGFCSMIDGTGSAATTLHEGAFRLPPGDYLLQVRASCGDNPCDNDQSRLFNYRLAITIR